MTIASGVRPLRTLFVTLLAVALVVSAASTKAPHYYDDDPISREPNYKQCAVRIEKTSPSAVKSVRRGFFFKKSAVVKEKRA